MIGRASIKAQALIQLSNIETKRVTQLRLLNEKYSASDKAKTSMGYVAWIMLSLLYGAMFLNDGFKLLSHMLTKFLFNEKQNHTNNDYFMNENNLNYEKQKEENAQKHVSIQMEQRIYSEHLERRLERVHLKLVSVVQNNKCNLKPN